MERFRGDLVKKLSKQMRFRCGDRRQSAHMAHLDATVTLKRAKTRRRFVDRPRVIC